MSVTLRALVGGGDRSDRGDRHLAVEATLNLMVKGPLQRDGAKGFPIVEGNRRKMSLDLTEDLKGSL